jgi:hypothetical protein
MQIWAPSYSVYLQLVTSVPGLPDVSFQTKNPNSGKFLEGLRFENVDIFYGHMEYFADIWDIL